MDTDKYVATPVGFTRVTKAPLDKYSTFNSYQDLKEYIKSGPAYAGQKIYLNYKSYSAGFVVVETKNGLKLVPAYDKPIDEHIVTSKQLRGTATPNEGYEDVSATNNITMLTPDADRWLMVYDYNATSGRLYKSVDAYNQKAKEFSIMIYADLYAYIYESCMCALVVNGKIEAIWTQNEGFLTGIATDQTNGFHETTLRNYCINFEWTPRNTGEKITFPGMFPKRKTTDNVALYINIERYLEL